MRPDVGSIRRLIIRSVVVLPEPDGPTRITISPSLISSVSSSTAFRFCPGNRFVSFSSTIIGCASDPFAAAVSVI